MDLMDSRIAFRDMASIGAAEHINPGLTHPLGKKIGDEGTENDISHVVEISDQEFHFNADLRGLSVSADR